MHTDTYPHVQLISLVVTGTAQRTRKPRRDLSAGIIRLAFLSFVRKVSSSALERVGEVTLAPGDLCSRADHRRGSIE